MNAHRINAEKMSDISNGRTADFFFMEQEDAEAAVPQIVELVKDIRRTLDSYGIAYDKKKFKAHITVARRVQTQYPIRVRIPEQAMEVTGFSLMKSERVNGRMKYTELACWEVH